MSELDKAKNYARLRISPHNTKSMRFIIGNKVATITQEDRNESCVVWRLKARKNGCYADLWWM